MGSVYDQRQYMNYFDNVAKYCSYFVHKTFNLIVY